jgi:hypothetical protein
MIRVQGDIMDQFKNSPNDACLPATVNLRNSWKRHGDLPS